MLNFNLSGRWIRTPKYPIGNLTKSRVMKTGSKLKYKQCLKLKYPIPYQVCFIILLKHILGLKQSWLVVKIRGILMRNAYSHKGHLSHRPFNFTSDPEMSSLRYFKFLSIVSGNRWRKAHPSFPVELHEIKWPNQNLG